MLRDIGLLVILVSGSAFALSGSGVPGRAATWGCLSCVAAHVCPAISQ
jgi:hypothetical protein